MLLCPLCIIFFCLIPSSICFFCSLVKIPFIHTDSFRNKISLFLMFDYFLTQMFIWTNKTVYSHKIKNNNLAIHIHAHIHIWINVVKWMHPHLDFAQIMFSSETGAPQDTDLAWTPRGHIFWPLGSSQQQAHRVAGRLMHTTHTHTQWYDEWHVREQQHVHIWMAWGEIKLSPLNEL